MVMSPFDKGDPAGRLRCRRQAASSQARKLPLRGDFRKAGSELLMKSWSTRLAGCVPPRAVQRHGAPRAMMMGALTKVIAPRVHRYNKGARRRACGQRSAPRREISGWSLVALGRITRQLVANDRVRIGADAVAANVVHAGRPAGRRTRRPIAAIRSSSVGTERTACSVGRARHVAMLSVLSKRWRCDDCGETRSE
jgi:hypothetical protein